MRRRPKAMLDFGFYNMDCMDGMREFPDNYFDLAIVDPPYRDENNPTEWMKRVMSNNNLFVSGKPDDKYFIELSRISKSQIIFGANNYGREFRGAIVWDKGIRGGLYSECEIASVSDNISTLTKYCYAYVTDKNKVHPTQKPVALYKWILQHYAKPGDKILDTHVGSASSLIACYDMGFDYVGFEIDEEYYKKAKQRLEDEMAQVRFTW